MKKFLYYLQGYSSPLFFSYFPLCRAIRPLEAYFATHYALSIAIYTGELVGELKGSVIMVK